MNIHHIIQTAKVSIIAIVDKICPVLRSHKYIKIANVIFMTSWAIIYIDWLINPKHVYPLSLWDGTWFLLDKLFCLFIYLYILCKEEDSLLKLELIGITFFCFVRVLWQITEIIDFNLANNVVIKLIEALICLMVCVQLTIYRFLIKKYS